jgi:ketosteroid isomerase-like protein
MSLLATFNEAFQSGDRDAMDALLHDDYRFIPHVGGVTMTKADMLSFAGSDAVRQVNHRILFENDEVGVEHAIVHFANGSTSEAVLSFHRFEGGKILSTETGATPLSEDYHLIDPTA